MVIRLCNQRLGNIGILFVHHKQLHDWIAICLIPTDGISICAEVKSVLS